MGAGHGMLGGITAVPVTQPPGLPVSQSPVSTYLRQVSTLSHTTNTHLNSTP